MSIPDSKSSMIFIINIFLIFFLTCGGVPINIPGMPNHTDFTTTEKIEFDGFTAETFTVTTTDGYINTIHRIPPKIPGSPIVLLQHGLLSTSCQWVFNIPSNNLAYILHNANYDVWMPNFRGNTYSRNHTTLDPNVTSNIGNGFTGYWNFTYHEMAIYDLTAFIDLALSSTGLAQLYYIGHSMGTTTYFILCSEIPEYRDRIKYAIHANPVAYTANIKSPIGIIARLIIPGVTQPILESLGPGEYMPSNSIIQQMITAVCIDVTDVLCSSLYFLQFGYDPAQLNRTMVPIYSSQMPAGSSTKTVIHYAQGVNEKDFRKFNYGTFANLAYYGSPVPPRYNLRNVNRPMAFLWGQNDWLADPKDVAKLTQVLQPNYANQPQNFQVFRINFDQWNHADYLMAIQVVPLAYDLTMHLLSEN